MFKPIEFVNNLKYMGLGMLGIFIVMGAIIGVTYLLNKAFASKN
ncbi:MAG: oxaloacetate decarboxylase [Clostridia bacterium]|nr:oxaloacetate decarboxylase [Clostridia bacterium]MBO7150865.1 oxaloacetate decarboxylase [Clostridia bacterium]